MLKTPVMRLTKSNEALVAKSRGVRKAARGVGRRPIAARRAIEVWWLQLLGGLIAVALGFWAAGYWGRGAVLLVAWAAAFAVIRGVRDIVFAFRVRELQHPARTWGDRSPRPRCAMRRIRTRVRSENSTKRP